MNSRERLKKILSGEIPDRVGMVDISYWPATIRRWRGEGLPEGVSPARYFDLDVITLLPFDSSLRLPEQKIEETGEYEIVRDSNGVTLKRWKNRYATPLQLDFLIKTLDDWRRYKGRIQPSRDRIAEKHIENFHNARRAGKYITFRPVEPCWYALRLLGHENALMLMIENPEFIVDIISTQTDFVISMCTIAMDEGLHADGLWFFADLCYKNGMLFSPRVYRELVMPFHRKIADFCHANGMPLIFHCDGDVRQLIPLLIEAGFDAIQPLEARCGNDVRQLKPLYGDKIVLFGNISTDVMSRSKEEIEEEVRSKVLAAKEGGRYIYHCDHSIPPTVSFENYSFTIELVKRYGAY